MLQTGVHPPGEESLRFFERIGIKAGIVRAAIHPPEFFLRQCDDTPATGKIDLARHARPIRTRPFLREPPGNDDEYAMAIDLNADRFRFRGFNSVNQPLIRRRGQTVSAPDPVSFSIGTRSFD